MVNMKRDRFIKIAVFSLFVIFYILMLAHRTNLPNGDDLPRHIENGKMLLQGHFDVLYKNYYSYTEPDHVFINHHWFYGVIAFLVYKVGSWPGLNIFNILVFLATFTILFKAGLK